MNHPLSIFNHCPVCGSARFVIKDFKAKKCEECQFVYYFNSAAAVAAFITDKEGRLLVARRAKEPAKGTLDLPGGFIDLHETAEEAILREIKEETGLALKNPSYLFSLPNIYHYSGLDVHTVDLFFHLSVEGNEPIIAADDVSELFFLDKNEIDPKLFGLDSISKAVAHL